PTLELLVSVMVHSFALPGTGVQLLDHPSKTELASGVAISVTVWFRVNVPVQVLVVLVTPSVEAQLMSFGPCTEPPPAPRLITVNVGVVGLPVSTWPLGHVRMPLAEITLVSGRLISAVMVDVPRPPVVAHPDAL